jgi:hypothetical protein
VSDEGWFEIEEQVKLPCDCPGCGSGEPKIVKRKIRFVGKPSRAAEAWLTEATRDNRTDPRLYSGGNY